MSTTIDTYMQSAQVLKALADHPTGPETIPHLVYLSALLSQQQDTSRWRNTNLVPALLSVLRSLSTTRPSLHAIRACAAAVAALNNTYTGIYTADLLAQFRAQLMSDDAACRAFVRLGLGCPEASEPLPLEHAVFIPRDATLVPTAATCGGHPFWSPLTCCMSFLCDIATLTSPPEAPRLPPGIKDAINPAMMERVMTVAVQHPCGAVPACPSRALVPVNTCQQARPPAAMLWHGTHTVHDVSHVW
jgi:hypothetical protein